MNSRNKVTQIYGYAVCLVAVITFLIAVTGLVGSFFDLSDPLHANIYSRAPSLASFETYRMEVLSKQSFQEGTTSSYVPDERTLHAMYDAAVADQVRAVKLQAHRNIIVDGLMILLAMAHFSQFTGCG